MPTKQRWEEIQKAYPMEEVKITYDPAFYRMLDFLAKQYATNRSRLVRTLIYEYQNKQEKSFPTP